LTGETAGYYRDFAETTAQQLARVLAQGFVFQGEHSPYHGHPRGEPTTGLPPTSFVLFLQNHDQVGNRALGERLTVLVDACKLEAAIAVQLLCPQIPLIFMGEDDASRSPFLFFTDHGPDLAAVVRDGRRREFARFPAFADAAQRDRIPDPNDPETFQISMPLPDPERAAQRQALYHRLLMLRHSEIMPRLDGTRSLEAKVVGPAAVVARWRLGDGTVLTLAVNLGDSPVATGPLRGRLIFATREVVGGDAPAGMLDARSTVALLEQPC
jgi:1,4-alpha-glucan branching enzyme